MSAEDEFHPQSPQSFATVKALKHGRGKQRPNQALSGSSSSSQIAPPANPYSAQAKTVSGRGKSPAQGGASGSVDAIRFWGQFLDNPSEAKNHPKYHKFVWGGVPPELDLRRQVWPSLCAEITEVKSPTAGMQLAEFEPVDEFTIEEIKIELENDDVFSHLNNENGPTREAVERLVSLVHQAVESQHRYIPGSVQLAALFLDVCDQNVNESFKLMTALLKKMEKYMDNNYLLLRNECLVIADVLAREVGSLANRFNETGFDVVDMTDLLCIWSAPLFAYHFPKEFVFRVLDLIFAEGPQILGNVIFAIIFVFQEELEMIKIDTSREGEAGKRLYQTLYDIPTRITSGKIEKIFKVGYEMILNFPKMAELRNNKDWEFAIANPGPLRFKKGVGDGKIDEDEKEEKPHHAIKTIRSVEKDEDGERMDSPIDDNSDEDDDAEKEEPIPSITLLDVQEMRKPEELFDKIKKIAESNQRLRKAQEQARQDLKDRAARITQLESEIHVWEKKLKGSGASSPTLRLPMAAGVISAFVGDLRALEQLGPNAIKVGEAKNPDDDSKYHSFALHDFNISYSNIYEQMDFPCVYMEGYLFKLTRSGMFNKLNLNRRWFVLKGRFLTYFKSHLHTKPQKDRCVDLKGCTVTPITKHPKGEYVFEVASTTHKFLLFAPDQKEMAKWLISLRAAVV